MPNVISKPSGTTGALLLGAALAAGGTAVCLYLLLKNDDNWNLDREAPIKTSKQVVIDVKIPKESVGVVIGRQGSNIREIQAKTETRINFRDELETETHRVCCIRGLAEDVQLAEILIHQTIASQPRLESLTLTVPSGCVGRIIGRQGDNIRDIQRISGARVDVDRQSDNAMERKVVMKGTSKQISVAKDLIMEKVKDEEMIRNNIMSNRQPRMRNNQPLFLSYDQEEAGESLSPRKHRQEVLEANAGDNCVEVFVSVVENPGQFWVQNIGSMSVELDKNDKEITDFYSEITNRKLMAVTSVQVGDIVAAQFSLEERYYRARIVSVQEDTYDYNQSTVELFFVDYGESEEKSISEVFELKHEFLKLKFQAIECRLASVRPAPGPGWSDEASDQLCRLSHCAQWRPVVARIMEVTEDTNVPVVELMDGQETNIGSELVDLGVAQW